MNVLIVVDMQNDFISGALGSAQAQAIEPAVVETILNFDGAIYFTLDTHQENYLETQEGRRLPTAHCIAGTEGWTPSAAVWMALMEQNVADEAHMVLKDAFGAKELPFRLHEDLGDDIREITLPRRASLWTAAAARAQAGRNTKRPWPPCAPARSTLFEPSAACSALRRIGLSKEGSVGSRCSPCVRPLRRFRRAVCATG